MSVELGFGTSITLETPPCTKPEEGQCTPNQFSNSEEISRTRFFLSSQRKKESPDFSMISDEQSRTAFKVLSGKFPLNKKTSEAFFYEGNDIKEKQEQFSGQFRYVLEQSGFSEAEIQDPKLIEAIVGIENFDFSHQEIVQVSEKTRLSIAEIYSSIQYGHAMEDYLHDINNQEGETETLSHISRVSHFSRKLGTQIEEPLERMLFVNGTCLHDVAKISAGLEEIRHINDLSQAHTGDISKHSAPENPFIQLIASELMQFIAIGHHSMSAEKKQELNKLYTAGKIPNKVHTVSHDWVIRKAKELSKKYTIPEETLMRVIIRTRLLDAFDAVVALRDYRNFPMSIEQGIHEAISTIHELDPQGKYKDVISSTISWMTDQVTLDDYTERTNRTRSDFVDYQFNLEAKLQNKFGTNFATLSKHLELLHTAIKKGEELTFETKEYLARILEGYFKKTGQIISEDPDKLYKQLKQIFLKNQIFVRAKHDIRLVEQDTFVSKNHLNLSADILAKLTYREMLAMLELFEPKIAAESRIGREPIQLTEEEAEKIGYLFPETKRNRKMFKQ